MNLHEKRTLKETFAGLQAQRRRGSTILLVLAMLTILLLIGIAFSYSTRLETQASNNYAELMQARTAAATGLPAALPLLLQASQGVTTTQQSWNTVPQALQKMTSRNGSSAKVGAAELAQLRQAGLNVSSGKEGQLESAPQANIAVRDLSGLVNLNAIDNAALMERVVNAVLPGGNTRQQATVLMALRGDLQRAAVQQNRDYKSRILNPKKSPEPQNLDLRDPNAQLLDSLQRLNVKTNGNGTAFSEQDIDKLKSVVTVFSQAPETFNATNGQHIPRIPLNDLQPKLVYDTLRQAFPGKKKELLLQYAANLVDFSDDDDKPTVLDSEGNVVAVEAATGKNQVLGVEMVPFLSEVYPDAATPVAFDDDGQFVEIANPWNKSVSLAGWTLRTGQGGSVALNATLPANGYLIITDNYDTPRPDTPSGQGSVVSLFGATANGSNKQVMPYPGLNLVDRNSQVSLYNSDGELVDVFNYGSTGSVDSKMSFQRQDPTVRGARVAEATPMAPAIGASTNVEAMSAATNAWDDGNTSITKISQLFTISTGFAEAGAAGTELTGMSAGTVHPAQLPELKAPEKVTASAQKNNQAANTQDDAFPDNLDLRLVDLFTATPRDLPEVTSDTESDSNDNSSNGRDAYQAFQAKMERLRQHAQSRNSRTRGFAQDEPTTDPTVYSYGKLNLNTCPKVALLGLNIDGVVAGGVASLVEQFEGYRLTQGQQGKAPFANVSDFISQFVPNISRSNIEVLDTITNQVTVGSSAFEITATNRLSAKDQAALENTRKGANGPRPATATAQWMISTDQKPYSIVSFSMTP